MRVASPHDRSRAIHFEIHGDGTPLLLGFPMMASHAETFGQEGAAVLRDYLERLTDRYRVLLVDYPSIGKSDTIPPGELTADRVCADLLAVAASAGFDGFAYWGHSWGGAVGLQLASRTERLSALVCSGWPPLGGPYAEVLQGARLQVANPPAYAMAVLRDPGQYAQWVTFYESIEGWTEADAVARLACPRLAVFGSAGDSDAGGVAIPIASRIRAHRAELEGMGWTVREIPDRDHSMCLDPAAIVPVVREFLDAVVPVTEALRPAGPRAAKGRNT
jgi:pimeloyl-ACP methyl ester carboxylesterase